MQPTIGQGMQTPSQSLASSRRDVSLLLIDKKSLLGKVRAGIRFKAPIMADCYPAGLLIRVCSCLCLECASDGQGMLGGGMVLV